LSEEVKAGSDGDDGEFEDHFLLLLRMLILSGYLYLNQIEFLGEEKKVPTSLVGT